MCPMFHTHLFLCPDFTIVLDGIITRDIPFPSKIGAARYYFVSLRIKTVVCFPPVLNLSLISVGSLIFISVF